MCKKLLVWLLVLAMAFTMSTGSVFADEETVDAATALVGKYITLGTYNNVPVTYKVWGTRDVDGDGNAEILVAPENSLFCMEWGPVDSDDNNNGDWETSTLRTYLNNTETGFLSNFTETERSLIVPVTQKTLCINGAIATASNKKKFNNLTTISGATTYDAFKTAYEAAATAGYGYDDCWYKNTTDSVFIPSFKDIYDFGIAPYSTVNTLTSGGTTSDSIWIRDHYESQKVWRWYKDGRILSEDATGTNQIRPTFYIKADFGGMAIYGTGDATAPYHLITEEIDQREGKLITFGTYNGKDVLYRIEGNSDVDGDGKQELLLVSNRIVDYKAFDADNSNDWATSDLRTFLNSTESTGFMNGMNEKELAAVASVTHKSIAPSATGADGGWESHKWNDGVSGVKHAFTNYDTAYYKLSTDKVFALSIEDVVRYDIVCPAHPANDLTPPDSGLQYCWWFRDANDGSTTNVRRYVNWNPVRVLAANDTRIGVRPALFIDAETTLYGEGTELNPYSVNEKTTTGVSELTVDNSGVVTATMYNYTGAEQTYRLIVAEYNTEDGSLGNVYIYPLAMTGEETIKTVSSDSVDLTKEGAEYKAFIWGGTSLIMPYHVTVPIN